MNSAVAATRKQTNPVTSSASWPVDEAGSSRLFAAFGLALFMARFFVPAESAALGDTLWLVVLWLFAGSVWFLAAFRTGERPLHWDRYNAAVWVLVVGHLVAAGSVLATEGHQRAALNMFWEWVGVGLSVSLLRRWMPARLLREQVAGVVCVTCVVLAGLGVWQFAVWMPANRALVEQYQELSGAESLTPQEAARFVELQREIGGVITGGDRVAQEAFLQRLLSSEPIGRFALANTLAGLLAVGVVVLCGGLVDCFESRRSRWRLAALGICLLLVGFCLVLTKSRTAWLASLCGLVTWLCLAYGRRVLSRQMLGRLLAAAGLVGVLAMVGILSGALDRFVISEAFKSLRYRLEYWRGTWGVIAEHPWLGVGPGNFRQHYLKYKLPESSEEILDPHNLFLDAWANGGVIGLGGLVAVVAFFVMVMRRAAVKDAASIASFGATSAERHDAFVSGRRLIWVGVCGLGLVCAYLWGMAAEPVDELLVLLGGWIVVCAVLPRFRVSQAVWCGCGAALLVHLLAAGGLGMPAVSILLLVLLSSGSDAVCTDHGRPAAAHQQGAVSGGSGFVSALLAAIVAGVGLTCLWTGFVPVFSARVFIGAAEHAAGRQRNPERARRDLARAAENDCLDPTPWMFLAQIDHQASQRSSVKTDREFQSAVTAMREAIARDPVSPKRYWVLGQWQFERARETDDRSLLDDALENLRRAAAGYPNHSGIQASLADALAAAGDIEPARSHALRALELDDLNRSLGHYDRLLGDEARARLEAI